MSELIDLLNVNNEKVDKISINQDLFFAPVKEVLIKQFVLLTLSNKRLGLASTKNRKIVSGGGKKPWKQKGTGRARAGSIRSPLWKGGGVIFGPTNERNWKMDLPKKARKGAIRSTLSLLYSENKIIFLDDFDIPEIKTKIMLNIFKTLNVAKGLLILPDYNEKIMKSVKNLMNYKVATVNNLSIVDLMKYEKVIISKKANDELERSLIA
jgi:large subunit ribosomal protein L4